MVEIEGALELAVEPDGTFECLWNTRTAPDTPVSVRVESHEGPQVQQSSWSVLAGHEVSDSYHLAQDKMLALALREGRLEAPLARGQDPRP